MKKILQASGLLLVFFLSGHVQATFGVSVAYGGGTQKLKAQRFAMQNSWENWITINKRVFNGYWEVAFTDMHKESHLRAMSGAAVLRFKQKLFLPLSLYLDLGLGVSYISTKEFANRDLGSRWLFEERLGIGTLFGKQQQLELGYRVMHFSNGYLANKNHGLNLHLLVLGYWF